ncbi:MAG: hypothetical protein ACTSQI_07230 [Candidatus Helarchaeota archaeon]
MTVLLILSENFLVLAQKAASACSSSQHAEYERIAADGYGYNSDG